MYNKYVTTYYKKGKMQMENSIAVQGQMEFMGLEIPVVYGGFGRNQMCISDKTVAEIHGQPMKEVRKTINRNIKRFKECVDYIDLKRGNLITTLEQLGYAKQSITQAEHIYLLSERGYAKLIKIMDDDKSWEVHDKLVDEYFNLREEVENQPAPSQIEGNYSHEEALLELYDLTGHDKDKTLEILNGLVGNQSYKKADVMEDTPTDSNYKPKYHSITELAESGLVPYHTTIKINNELRSLGILTRKKDNKPYQRYIDAGYFKYDTIKEYDSYDYKQEPVKRKGWVLTPKGWEWVIKLLLESNKPSK